jgi:hypothetical protein
VSRSAPQVPLECPVRTPRWPVSVHAGDSAGPEGYPSLGPATVEARYSPTVCERAPGAVPWREPERTLTWDLGGAGGHSGGTWGRPEVSRRDQAGGSFCSLRWRVRR